MIMVQNGNVAMNLLLCLWGGGSEVCQYLHAKITDRLLIKIYINNENGT